MIKSLFIPTKKNNHRPYLLRKIAIIAYTFILISVNSFGGLLGITEVQASTITPENIINLTNQERLRSGLNTLSNNAQLSSAALAKANDMFEKQYWDHFGPNGESPWQFIRESGYSYVYAGENLAKGFRTAEGVHEAWMASPTHKANIISGNYKDIGVAVVDGILLGKQTTLVVQMFGNLTNEVYGASQTPVDQNAPPAESSEETVVAKKETGQIKSIRITSPQEGTIITNPAINVLGEAQGTSGEYTVEIYENEKLIGDTKSSEKTWEFDKNGDWEEGNHTLNATLKETNVKSDTVNFTIDSSAPTVDESSIKVSKNDNFYDISFKIDGEWNSLRLVLGSETIDVEYSQEDTKVKIQLNEEQIKGSVIVVLSDSNNNISELDISEYFIDEEDQNSFFFPILSLNMGDKISIGIVSFVLVLLIIEVAVYWKKGKLKDVLNDIFTIGVWWLILTMAIFNGFSGVIN